MHPDWASGVDYRHLVGDPPRLRRVSAPTPARLIDHATQQYGREVVLVRDTSVWWVGSSYQRDHTGNTIGSHVFEILDGPLRGECVAFVEDPYTEDPEFSDGPSASLRPVD